MQTGSTTLATTWASIAAEVEQLQRRYVRTSDSVQGRELDAEKVSLELAIRAANSPAERMQYAKRRAGVVYLRELEIEDLVDEVLGT